MYKPPFPLLCLCTKTARQPRLSVEELARGAHVPNQQALKWCAKIGLVKRTASLRKYGDLALERIRLNRQAYGIGLRGKLFADISPDDLPPCKAESVVITNGTYRHLKKMNIPVRTTRHLRLHCAGCCGANRGCLTRNWLRAFLRTKSRLSHHLWLPLPGVPFTPLRAAHRQRG